MPAIRPDMAVGAWWLWGTMAEAGKHLGVSPDTFRKLLGGKAIRDDTQRKIDAAWKRLSSDEKHAVRFGGEFVHALSRKQATVLRGDNPEKKVFKGRDFIRAVKQFTRRRDRIPKSVGDFIEEVGSP